MDAQGMPLASAAGEGLAATRVDFVYDEACPNVKAARGNLMRAFARAGITAAWTEHRIGDPDGPAHVRGYGSPTVLVDGRDVAGLEPSTSNCCRVYGQGGVPGVEIIVEALQRAERRDERAGAAILEDGGAGHPSRWKSMAAVLPGIGVALMPKIVCPFCWPAYVGLLGAAGLTFLMEDRWLLPISAVFLAIALMALAWRARSRRGFGPLWLGVSASGAILVGKFAFDSTTFVYGGIAALVAACVWNAWPPPRPHGPSCSACRIPETS